jgi:rare lipoprotein A
LVPPLSRRGSRLFWALAFGLAVSGCATARAPMAPTGQASRTPEPEPGAPRQAPRVQVGTASWYGKPHHGRKTASGEIYDMYALTAAHPSWPLGTRVRVTNLENGRMVDVRINDRGPVVRGRIIDLSYAAAVALNAVSDGTFRVRIRSISDAVEERPPEPRLEGDTTPDRRGNVPGPPELPLVALGARPPRVPGIGRA